MFPQCNRAYISAFTADSVTISGPPTTLEHLWDSFPNTSTRIELPVYGPYHAPHLHRGVDMAEVLCLSDPRRSRTLANYRLVLPLMSTSAGTCYEGSQDAPSILAAVVNDILGRVFKVQDVVDGCIDLVTTLNCNQCNFISIGPSNSENMFVKALNSGTNIDVACHVKVPRLEESRAMSDAPRTSRKPKLAIVGMAGRFPDAADHEKFWDLLEAGLDVHRRVRFLFSTHILIPTLTA